VNPVLFFRYLPPPGRQILAPRLLGPPRTSLSMSPPPGEIPERPSKSNACPPAKKVFVMFMRIFSLFSLAASLVCWGVWIPTVFPSLCISFSNLSALTSYINAHFEDFSPQPVRGLFQKGAPLQDTVAVPFPPAPRNCKSVFVLKSHQAPNLTPFVFLFQRDTTPVRIFFSFERIIISFFCEQVFWGCRIFSRLCHQGSSFL